MRAVQTDVENRLHFPLIALNAPLGTTLSNLPSFDIGSVKTSAFCPERDMSEVKTDLARKVSPFAAGKLPVEATGLRLCKIFPGDDLRLCEAVRFTGGWKAVDTTLRRAAISGRVEVDPDGPLPDYFADILDANADMIGNVALDRGSFRALKGHWMRCKYEPHE